MGNTLTAEFDPATVERVVHELYRAGVPRHDIRVESLPSGRVRVTAEGVFKHLVKKAQEILDAHSQA